MALVSGTFSDNRWLFTSNDDDFVVATAIPFPSSSYHRLLATTVRTNWYFLGMKLVWAAHLDPEAILIESVVSPPFLLCYEWESGFVVVLAPAAAQSTEIDKIISNAIALLKFILTLIGFVLDSSSLDFSYSMHWQSAATVNL